jgi:hypothetical protein
MAGKDTGHAPSLARLTSVDEAILQALYDFHYLTAEQLCRLRYSPSSLNHVREQLKKLHDAEYLQRVFGPRKQASGSTPWVYLLGRKGLAHFRDLGYEGRRHRPSEQQALADQHLFHTLAINDVLIAARLLHQAVDVVSLVAIRHDLDLKRTPVKIETGPADPRSGVPELTSVVPDAWLHFQIPNPARDKPESAPLLLELDRGKKSVSEFKRKIRGLLAYTGRPYQTLFGVKSVTVAFVIDEGAFASPQQAAKRVADTRRWTEEELTEQRKEDWGEIFLFTSLPDPQTLDAIEFFLGHHALAPFTAQPLSLLDLPTTAPATGADGMSMSFPA